MQFDIKESSGPKLPPVRSKEQIESMYVQKDWATAMPFVKQTLGELREKVILSHTTYALSVSPIQSTPQAPTLNS